jgi:ribose 5-phosphate isomerase B
MKIALGADHAGLELKQHLKAFLERQGHEVEDFGTGSSDPTDYPDYAEPVARAVAAGASDRGLLVCGTGTGMAIAANKVPRVRAAAATDPESARLARAHNDANVLALAGRRLAPAAAEEILATFLATPFEGGRHLRRLEKIRALEADSCS